MEAKVGHIQFNVRGENLPFYKRVAGISGLEHALRRAGDAGMGGANGQSLWFGGRAKEVENDYDGPGMNHLAFSAASVAESRRRQPTLMEQGVPLL